MLRATWRGLETWHSRAVRPNRRASPRPYREEAARDRSSKGGTALVAYFHRRDGPERQRVMTLAPNEFIRRFLLHVLPRGFHRIRHYGLLASSARKASIAHARKLLAVAPPPEPVESPEPLDLSRLVPAAAGAVRDGGNPARHPRRPHQPGAADRDPARLALISRRNIAVATNAPIHALPQDQRNRTEYEPSPVPDLHSAWQQIALIKSPSTPAPSWFRHHRDQAKLAIPIDHRRSPAGSCFGGFRTPAHALASGLRWPAFTITVA